MDTLKSYHQSESVAESRYEAILAVDAEKKKNKTHKIQLIFSLQYHSIHFQVEREIEVRKFQLGDYL